MAPAETNFENFYYDNLGLWKIWVQWWNQKGPAQFLNSMDMVRDLKIAWHSLT